MYDELKQIFSKPEVFHHLSHVMVDVNDSSWGVCGNPPKEGVGSGQASTSIGVGRTSH